MDSYEQFDLLSTMEIDHLRVEALDLYDRCLAEGNPGYVLRFVERQLSSSPPRLLVLRSLADDIQQRLVELREDLFQIREKVITTFDDIYHIDVTNMMPPEQLEYYHQIEPEAVISYLDREGLHLSSEEKQILKKMLQTSSRMAAQIRDDIQLTQNIYNMITDWLYPLSAKMARSEWLLQFYQSGDVESEDHIH